jgi:hypothetical protein
MGSAANVKRDRRVSTPSAPSISLLVKTMEEEEVAVWPLTAESWSVLNVMPNLRWIVPLANGHKDDHVWIYEVIEKEVFA